MRPPEPEPEPPQRSLREEMRDLLATLDRVAGWSMTARALWATAQVSGRPVSAAFGLTYAPTVPPEGGRVTVEDPGVWPETGRHLTWPETATSRHEEAVRWVLRTLVDMHQTHGTPVDVAAIVRCLDCLDVMGYPPSRRGRFVSRARPEPPASLG